MQNLELADHQKVFSRLLVQMNIDNMCHITCSWSNMVEMVEISGTLYGLAESCLFDILASGESYM